VLDMGCGRGAVLAAVGTRLTSGRVTGIDIWSSNPAARLESTG